MQSVSSFCAWIYQYLNLQLTNKYWLILFKSVNIFIQAWSRLKWLKCLQFVFSSSRLHSQCWFPFLNSTLQSLQCCWALYQKHFRMEPQSFSIIISGIQATVVRYLHLSYYSLWSYWCFEHKSISIELFVRAGKLAEEGRQPKYYIEVSLSSRYWSWWNAFSSREWYFLSLLLPSGLISLNVLSKSTLSSLH